MDAPPESQASASQIHPLLRQRMLNRAATYTEGLQSTPPLRPRRSSILSDFSDARRSSRSSIDNALRPTSGRDLGNQMDSAEASLWDSAPLAFALLPAAAGLLFKNGGSIVTDILLLGFSSMFLNWCVREPWIWYHTTQQIQYIEDEDNDQQESPIDSIPEVDEDAANPDVDRTASTPESTSKVPPTKEESTIPGRTVAQTAADRELAREEIMALIACFVGPLLGAYLLHAIRSQLSRPIEGLVSNYSLSIFVMAAELRPILHVIKLRHGRIVRLQRIARGGDVDRSGKANARDLARRIEEVEARLAEPHANSDAETTKISASVRQGLQPQLDALNRAVRRYEKRQAAQSIQIEARFAALELRMQDALTLAAAAARTTQRPGLVSVVLTWVLGIFTYCFQTFLSAFTYPLRVAISIAIEIRSWFVKPEQERQPRKRFKGPGGSHPVSSTKSQSRAGR